MNEYNEQYDEACEFYFMLSAQSDNWSEDDERWNDLKQARDSMERLAALAD